MKGLLKKIPKQNYLILILGLILICSIMIPSLARYKNRNTIKDIEVWDGNVATSYRSGSGTIDDPYIISNGNELAYFAQMLKTTDYADTYFELNKDIVLNDGIFSYDEEGIKYKLNNTTFYVKENTNEIYDNVDKTGTKIKSINLFESLNNFKGNLDGNYFRIYGLYISSENEEAGLFTNLSGNVSNLYVENAMIYGGNITAGIASSATNSKITNVLYNGYVVGTNEELTKTETFNVPTISNFSNIMIPYIKGDITNVTIKGSIGENKIKINNNEVTGDFSLDLGNISKIVIDTNITLDNLTYDITYNYGISSGIVANADKIILNNVINKSNVIGKNSVGLVGYTNDITINKSYNNGTLSGDKTSGLINKLHGKGTLNKVYSTGNVTHLINNVTNGNLTINNSFATETTYLVNSIISSVVSFKNSYYTDGNITNEGSIFGSVTLTDINNLKDKEFVINNLQFNEFIDSTDLTNNEENVWVYEEGSFPILATDDINNPIANIHVGTYSWNNLGYELNSIKFNKATAFSIEQIDPLRPFKEVSYYISDKELTKEEIQNLTFTNYENIVELNNEGKYVIYTKVVDNNDNIYYLNSDLIIVDLSGSDVTINMNDKTWNTLNNPTIKNYINENTDLTITAIDNLSGIKSVEYYLSNEIINEDKLDSVSWNTYNDKITINNKGTYILYVKVIDNADYITYVNSEYIIFDGYSVDSLNAGRNNKFTTNYITNKSSVTLNISYQSSYNYNEGKIHSIVSNTPLPLNTKITLIDNNQNKVYTYTVDKQDTNYNLTLFKEVGSDNLFSEDNYTNQINENFTIVLDFKNTDITNIEDIKIAMELNNQDSVIKTLTTTLKPFNIYESSASININSNYSDTIIYNSDSTNTIDITSNLVYDFINGNQINDTTYEDKIMGLNVSLVDKNGNIVNKEYLKNLIFKVNGKEYSPSNDGIVRIPDIGNLEITTSVDNSKLETGTYYFKIKALASYDGKYTNTYSNEITIPVAVTNNVTIDYGFDVSFDNVITDNIINFDIIKTGNFTNPTVRVSLYKKQVLSAYNQDYSLVDLSNYTTTKLNKITDNIYELPNKLELKNMLGGYKFVFELYDGTTKIGTIEKKFIVR